MFGNRLTDFYLSSAQITQQQLAIGLSLLRGRIPWQRRGRGRVLFAIPGTHAYRSTHISRISIRSTWVANVLSFLCSLIVLAIHIHWLSAFQPFYLLPSLSTGIFPFSFPLSTESLFALFFALFPFSFRFFPGIIELPSRIGSARWLFIIRWTNWAATVWVVQGGGSMVERKSEGTKKIGQL